MSCPCPEHSPDRPVPDEIGPAVVSGIDGTPIYGYSRLNTGHVLCQLCFGHFWPCQLDEPEPGVRSDICVACAETERNSYRCPRCLKVTVDAGNKLYEFCPTCAAFTGNVNPYEVCAIHHRHEPTMDGDYRSCLECCHVWRTEQEFIADVMADRANHTEAALRYEGITIPEDTTDPRLQPFCPLCTHDF